MIPRAVYGDLAIYRRLLRQARPFWPHIGGLFLISLAATPLALLAPVPLKIAVDSVLGSKPLPGFLNALLPASVTGSATALLVAAAVLMVVVVALTQFQSTAYTVFQTYTGERLLLDFRLRLFGHLQRLSLAYHDATGPADSMYRVQYDTESIQTIASDGVIPFVSSAVMLGAMFYVTARIDLLLAVVALVIAPLLFALTFLYRRRLRRRHREVKRLESSALAVVEESLGALRVVKAFGGEARGEERFLARSADGMRARVRVAMIDGAFGLLVGVITAAGTAVVLFVGVRQVQHGRLTLGDLLLVMGYLAQLYSPLNTISRKITSLQSAFASAERALGALDQEPDVIEREGARPLRRTRGALTFRDVSFGYEPDRPVLHDVSFHLEPGQRLGISGTTGAGKTTLVSLLMRFYDPDGGAVLLDGVDIRDFRVADLRNQFAMVLQEPVLFSTSIGENIAYARPTATAGEIVEAARAAGAHDFIAALPAGYDTLVGERGMRLSGGERQRISLARAFLKDAPVLILDEPTSSVDMATEAAIFEAMERLVEGRTTITIAHRLNTLEACDVRIRIEGGRLVEQRAPLSRVS